MPRTFTFQNYTITILELEREVNYVVSNANGYVCRLVPGEAGFEVSKADKAVGNNIPLKLLVSLSDFIVQQDA